VLEDGAKFVVGGSGFAAGFVHVLAVVLVGVLPALQQEAAHLVVPEGELFRGRHFCKKKTWGKKEGGRGIDGGSLSACEGGLRRGRGVK